MRKRLSEKKVNTVDVSPTDDWLLATSGLDRTVKLWDMRKAKKKELCALSYNRSTSSAFFNCDGTKLLITSMDDKLTILESPRAATGKTGVSKTLRHNNQTGRWLSVLHAMWHPRDPRAFVCGSLRSSPAAWRSSTRSQRCAALPTSRATSSAASTAATSSTTAST